MRVTLMKHGILKAALPKVSSVVLGLAAVLFGCSDAPTSPEPSAMPSFERSGGAAMSGSVAVVLTRTQPLVTGMSVTRMIGPAGGTIAIAAAGIKVTFPAGAIAAAVPITVTAPAGHAVAYSFGPHGLRFRRAVTVEVNLKRTLAESSRPVQELLEAAYYDDGLGMLAATGVALASEYRGVRFDGARAKVTFPIWHFSGYLLASGRQRK